MMTFGRGAREAAPGPCPIAIGTMAGTSITVVIRMGRSRVSTSAEASIRLRIRLVQFSGI